MAHGAEGSCILIHNLLITTYALIRVKFTSATVGPSQRLEKMRKKVQSTLVCTALATTREVIKIIIYVPVVKYRYIYGKDQKIQKISSILTWGGALGTPPPYTYLKTFFP
jgi:hypothetical protein